jgi:hypothetical protein
VREGVRTFRETGQLTQGSAAQRKRLGLPESAKVAAEELRELLGEGTTASTDERG